MSAWRTTKGPRASSPNLATTASPLGPATSVSLVSATLIMLLFDKTRTRQIAQHILYIFYLQLSLTFLQSHKKHLNCCR